MDIQPVPMRLIARPAFTILGKKVYISGPDNEQFGRFWLQCRADGLLDQLRQIQQSAGLFPGPQTNSAILGVSRVERDPAKRDFDYMIAIEAAATNAAEGPQWTAISADLEAYQVPAGHWAVFECHGPAPDSIVAAEMYAFMHWLPDSGFHHAHAPEIEVYLTSSDDCEFWLPIE